MRSVFPVIALAVGAWVSAPAALGGAAVAFAQAAQPQSAVQGGGSIYDGLEQIALTEEQVQNYIAAQVEMEAAMGEAAPSPGEPQDANAVAKLEAVAKKYKFANYEEFNQVAGNLALVIDGVDPKTKTYVGAEALLKRAIDDVKADPKMSDADKTSTVSELNDEMKTLTPVKFPANIDLAIKHYDSLVGGDVAPAK